MNTIIIAITCIVIVTVVYIVGKRVMEFLDKAKKIIDLASQGEKISMEEPKSINGMEALVNPRIQKDFPELSITELKSKDVKMTYEYLKALQTGDISNFENNVLKSKIEKQSIDKIKKGFRVEKIKIHKQSISHYSKVMKIAIIKIQTALEYIEYPKGEKTQTRVETKWTYSLDKSNFENGTAASVNCPNCGAVVDEVEQAICRYCGSGIVVDHDRTWKLSDIDII